MFENLYFENYNLFQHRSMKIMLITKYFEMVFNNTCIPFADNNHKKIILSISESEVKFKNKLIFIL